MTSVSLSSLTFVSFILEKILYLHQKYSGDMYFHVHVCTYCGISISGRSGQVREKKVF